MTSARIIVRVQAGARRTQILDVRRGVLHVRVAAPAPGPDANPAVCRLVARCLGVPASRVAIVRGRHAADKLVEVRGLDQARTDARLRGGPGGPGRRRQTVRRRGAAVGLVLAVVAVTWLLERSGPSRPAAAARVLPVTRRSGATRGIAAARTRAVRARAVRPATVRTAAPPSAPRRPPHPSPLPDPTAGSLRQTAQLPSAGAASFRAEMNALWEAIRTDSAGAGRPAFFPSAAYLQLKSVVDASSDYQRRLLVDYRLDIGAAHARLGAGPARLLRVLVPSANAHWVDPGVCANQLGYYEVPNARLVYSANGQVSSLGIASMISWRGQWYVIHLGAILRASTAGVVDDPSPGAGTSAPSSTC